MEMVNEKEETKRKIRQPIVTVAGHVDHGKTSILDTIRQTKIAEKEAGAITQKISFSIVPKDFIEKKCEILLKKFKIKIEVPGFLFIDTPGHAAFTNLRQRGGSIADLAILVIDINEGIKEQTREVIEILKRNKTPFLIALNKIDRITGWRTYSKPVFETINEQQELTKQEFYNKVLNIVSSFSILGLEAELYWNISDFTKKIAIVPCSAKTSEGIDEILVVLSGLSQKYLSKQLFLGKEARGNVLEVVKEKGILYYDCILYDGTLNKNNQIIIASLEKPIVTKIKSLFEALPLNKGFRLTTQISASSGFRMLLSTDEEIYSGMPFIAFSTKKEEDINELKEELTTELNNIIKKDKVGIIIKAESLGSLEAMINLLKKEGIKVKHVGIGDITKNDVLLASSIYKENPMDAIILGFNVSILPGVEKPKNIAIFTHDIIYGLIEDFLAWREEKKLEIERQKLSALVFPAKIKVLRGMVFRASKPAICGVRVIAGILRKNTPLMDESGKTLCIVKSLQSEGKSIEEARINDEIAIAMPEITIGRQVKEEEILYSDLSEEDFKKLKANKELLTKDELNVLNEIAEIKRRQKPTWGI